MNFYFISARKGESASFAILKCTNPIGIGMMAKNQIKQQMQMTPCPMAHGIPIKNQNLYIGSLNSPLSSGLKTTSLPNGQITSLASLKHCFEKDLVNRLG